MIELLRDPMWQFVGAVLGFIAIGIAILTFYLQRTKKSLGYEMISNTSLLTVREELEGKLQILYENEAVNNVQLIVIKLINIGNLPIASNDYELPLRLVFNDKEKILTAEVTEKVPDNLPVSLKLHENNIELTPTLLNSKDSITVKALISNYSEKPKIDGRIIGIKSIRLISDVSWTSVILILSGLILSFVGVFYSTDVPQPATPKTFSQNIAFALAMVGYLILSMGILSNKKFRFRLVELAKHISIRI